MASAAEGFAGSATASMPAGRPSIQIVLREPRDPKVRQMASKTITDQNSEIGELQAWLSSHGKRAQ